MFPFNSGLWAPELLECYGDRIAGRAKKNPPNFEYLKLLPLSMGDG